MFHQTWNARRQPEESRNAVFVPGDLDLWPWPSNSSEWATKHVFPVNLAQIHSAVPDIFHTEKKQTDGAKNRTFRSSLRAVMMPMPIFMLLYHGKVIVIVHPVIRRIKWSKSSVEQHAQTFSQIMLSAWTFTMTAWWLQFTWRYHAILVFCY